MITLNEFLIKKHTKNVLKLPIYVRIEDNKYTIIYCFIDSIDTYKQYEPIISSLDGNHNETYLRVFEIEKNDIAGIVLTVSKYDVFWNRIVIKKDDKLYSKKGIKYVLIPNEYVDEKTLTYEHFQELYNKYIK